MDFSKIYFQVVERIQNKTKTENMRNAELINKTKIKMYCLTVAGQLINIAHHHLRKKKMSRQSMPYLVGMVKDML